MDKIVNGLIDIIAEAIKGILSILPDSPLKFIGSLDSDLLQYINWLFPVKEGIAILEAYTAAVIVWYSIRVVAHWTKTASE